MKRWLSLAVLGLFWSCSYASARPTLKTDISELVTASDFTVYATLLEDKIRQMINRVRPHQTRVVKALDHRQWIPRWGKASRFMGANIDDARRAIVDPRYESPYGPAAEHKHWVNDAVIYASQGKRKIEGDIFVDDVIEDPFNRTLHLLMYFLEMNGLSHEMPRLAAKNGEIIKEVLKLRKLEEAAKNPALGISDEVRGRIALLGARLQIEHEEMMTLADQSLSRRVRKNVDGIRSRVGNAIESTIHDRVGKGS